MKKFILFLSIMLSFVSFAQNWNIDDGISYYNVQNLKKAEHFFKNYIKIYPNDSRGYYYLGLIYKDYNDLNNSRYYFEKSYSLSDNLTDVKIAPNVDNLPVEDYYDMAYMFFEQGDNKTALNYCNMLEEIYPDDDRVQYLKAQIYLKENEKEASKTCFLRALEINPKYLDTSLAGIFEIDKIPEFNDTFYNSKALQYFYASDIKKAEENFNKALLINPQNAEVLYNLGILYLTKGNYQNAENYFKRALKYEKNNSKIYVQLAKTTSDKKSAGNYLKRAVTVNPNDKNVYFELGLYYFDQKNFEEAFKNFKQAISFDNNFYEARLMSASSLIEMGKYQNAIIEIKEALKINSDNPEVLFYLAKLSILNHDFEGAKKYILSALSYANNPNYYLELGKIDYYMEDFKSAKDNFLKALELDMSFAYEAQLYNYLGLCEYKLGNYEKAQYDIEHALNIEYRIIYDYNLALICKSQEKMGKYNEIINKILTKKPKTVQEYLDLSNIYFDQKKSKMSLLILNDGISHFPDDRSLYEAKLNLLKELKDEEGIKNTKLKIKEKFEK